MMRLMIAIIVWSSLVEPMMAKPGIGRAPEPIPIRKLSITPAQTGTGYALAAFARGSRHNSRQCRSALLPGVLSRVAQLLSPRREDARGLNASMTMPLPDLKTLAADPSGPIGWIENAPLLKELDRAARRQYCDWDLVTRAEEGIGMLLPDIQSFRMFAPMLAVRARLELADGDFNMAERSLQTGLAFGRHLGDSPTLVQSLVAAAVTTVMLDQVEQWVERRILRTSIGH